jgi:hypothetical protein
MCREVLILDTEKDIVITQNTSVGVNYIADFL